MKNSLTFLFVLLFSTLANANNLERCIPQIKEKALAAAEVKLLKGHSLEPDYTVMVNDPVVKESGDVYFNRGEIVSKEVGDYISGITAYNSQLRLGFSTNIVVQFNTATCEPIILHFVNLKVLKDL